jgi:hypothetical protein
MFLLDNHLLQQNIIEHNILCAKATNLEITFEVMSRWLEVSITQVCPIQILTHSICISYIILN